MSNQNNHFFEYELCNLCPRKCGINRYANQVGFCQMGAVPVVNKIMLHFGEEPVISGKNGSGAVFFEGCTLRCIFCQNHTISRGNTGCGKTMNPDELAEEFLILQSNGAHNINLVTFMHFAPSVADAIRIAKNNGLVIPVVANISGYEDLNTLKLLDGLIDIYMPDFKFYSSSVSKKLSSAQNYFSKTCTALDEMYRQVGKISLGEDGMLKKGMIVRHLMLPGQVFDTKHILDYLSGRFSNNIYISLMGQYTPMPEMKDALSRKLSTEHYEYMCDYLSSLGQENAFIQEPESAGNDMIPDFSVSKN